MSVTDDIGRTDEFSLAEASRVARREQALRERERTAALTTHDFEVGADGGELKTDSTLPVHLRDEELELQRRLAEAVAFEEKARGAHDRQTSQAIAAELADLHAVAAGDKRQAVAEYNAACRELEPLQVAALEALNAACDAVKAARLAHDRALVAMHGVTKAGAWVALPPAAAQTELGRKVAQRLDRHAAHPGANLYELNF